MVMNRREIISFLQDCELDLNNEIEVFNKEYFGFNQENGYNKKDRSKSRSRSNNRTCSFGTPRKQSNSICKSRASPYGNLLKSRNKSLSPSQVSEESPYFKYRQFMTQNNTNTNSNNNQQSLEKLQLNNPHFFSFNDKENSLQAFNQTTNLTNLNNFNNKTLISEVSSISSNSDNSLKYKKDLTQQNNNSIGHLRNIPYKNGHIFSFQNSLN